MNKNIQHLYEIAVKPARIIIGLMSGTSLDGLDIALCRLSGSGVNTHIELLQFETASYPASFKEEIKTVFSKEQVSLEKVCLLNEWVGLEHARLINNFLDKNQINKNDVDIIASHGQTIYHAPKILHGHAQYPNGTLQIGDGDHIAVTTGIITISDFRQKHIAAGGEGAPLAVYGDYFIFGKEGENRIMLNIGGIANFTYLPGDRDANKVFSTDTGPGNTLMDAYMQKHFARYFDEGAAIAKQGKVEPALLHELKKDSFFEKGFPKTTGPELFNLAYLQAAQERAAVTDLSHEDIMATLNRFSADTIVAALKKCLTDNDAFTLYASGGGMHNPLLMESLQSQLPGYTFSDTGSLQVNPDAKEAVLFAILANECLCGGDASLGDGRSGIPHVSMGKISFPV
ncbi:MAG: anhydro-N-acetylmuramic acid kinase [Filimonas sp.]|nr:anhydro-N-acetylmuramic acid kinase [Filimonas sp.]